MMKVSMETSLTDSYDTERNNVAGIILDRLLNGCKRVFWSVLTQEDRTGKTARNQSLFNTSQDGFFAALMHYQQQKAQRAKQVKKDEFFFRTQVRRKNISQRTWKRHSAFLYYSRQVNQQKSQSLATSKLEAPTEKTAKPDGRMSFQVTSIESLPVWATALYDMSLINFDSVPRCLQDKQGAEASAALVEAA